MLLFKITSLLNRRQGLQPLTGLRKRFRLLKDK